MTPNRRNDTPYLIKRFANAEFVEYVEDTLLDTQNQVRAGFKAVQLEMVMSADAWGFVCVSPGLQSPQRFYVYVKNVSFQNLGVLEDYSVYKAEAEKWCVVLPGLVIARHRNNRADRSL